jgi:hypothetical protein
MSSEIASHDQNFHKTSAGVADDGSGDFIIFRVGAASKRLLVDSLESLPTTLGHGRKVVASAGIPVALASSTTCKEVTITALEGNTDVIVVGGTGVIAGTSGDAGATRTGVPLFPSNSITLKITNLANVYMDAVVSGNGVSFLYSV